MGVDAEPSLRFRAYSEALSLLTELAKVLAGRHRGAAAPLASSGEAERGGVSADGSEMQRRGSVSGSGGGVLEREASGSHSRSHRRRSREALAAASGEDGELRSNVGEKAGRCGGVLADPSSDPSPGSLCSRKARARSARRRERSPSSLLYAGRRRQPQ